ncbi:uncharacterized protein LOC123512699 isoform X2 [Portunus trituberculatus]|uniref:uncharacterized protein LOC123511699 isoform X2 n=1 Tax=Portunus trituberculatus TaxID=210409 RepID=UPI001E1CC1E1|nr:uncharacterized protein LOC123511699 isoform X2 [Portunus trituberculatus]XP_045125192.1 uncharacterized protein LOC123512699 isoform X2 [Portunus trituberculatus]
MEGLGVIEQPPIACNKTLQSVGMPEGGENNPPGYEAVLLIEALNEPCASPQQPSTPNGHNPSKQLPQNTTATPAEVLPRTEASRSFMEGLGVIEQPPIACNKTLQSVGMPEGGENNPPGYEAVLLIEASQ